MVRRSTPQAQIDEQAFPVRLFILVPEMGFGTLMVPMHKWLVANVGQTNHALHGSGKATQRDAVALYLRNPIDAVKFLQAFPILELADGTVKPGYYSPAAPRGNSEEEDLEMCNLYNQTKAVDAMRQLFAGIENRTGNLEPGSISPNYQAPIIRHMGEGRLELAIARWGMPSPKSVLKTERDPGVTNVRNLASPHWRKWLGPAHRCLVPVTSFAEWNQGNKWFGPTDEGAPMFFAGIEVRGWKSVRKVKDGETVDDLFAFLTCPPNAEVGAIHPKAMPVIFTKPAEWETWLGAPFEIAAQLQRPLPDGDLQLLDGPI
ncbi:hypothetical protein GCM10010873_16650 [Cypionkella aquatica]|uniref:Abasic site processing protein n=2 Tax=Cypionkella aquatica TaxID=1756042 RepID=A0AA37X383_9RHOB|nr:hypothetical protein GCM10010873_16650 [Cypionkella aquatica]